MLPVTGISEKKLDRRGAVPDRDKFGVFSFAQAADPCGQSDAPRKVSETRRHDK
jgi:hypothetical protein